MRSLKDHLLFILFASLVFMPSFSDANKKACFLPNQCRLDKVHNIYLIEQRKFLFEGEHIAFVCEPKSQTYTFDYEQWEKNSKFTTPDLWSCNYNELPNIIDLRCPPNQKLYVSNQILDNFFKFLLRSKTTFFSFQIFNSGGVILGHDNQSIPPIEYNISTKNFYDYSIRFIRSKIDFYINGKVVNSCQDIINANSSYTLMFRLLPKRTFGHILFLNCEYK